MGMMRSEEEHRCRSTSIDILWAGSAHGSIFSVKTFLVGASRLQGETFKVSLTAGVGNMSSSFVLELNWMNSVDKKEIIWWHWNKSGTCVSIVYCHCGSCFCIGAAELVLSIEGPLAILY